MGEKNLRRKQLIESSVKLKKFKREESRWRRNRTGRSLCLLQIHRKNNRTVKKVYKTTSDLQQQTSGAQKSSPLSSKGGRTKILKIKKGTQENEGRDPSREGILNRGSFQSPGNPRGWRVRGKFSDLGGQPNWEEKLNKAHRLHA